MRAQMVLTYIISKGVINNKTVEEIVCPALILAANSTDDLHVLNNIVTVNNCNYSFDCFGTHVVKICELVHFILYLRSYIML